MRLLSLIRWSLPLVFLLAGCETTTKVTRRVIAPFRGGEKAEKGVAFKKARLALSMNLSPLQIGRAHV